MGAVTPEPTLVFAELVGRTVVDVETAARVLGLSRNSCLEAIHRQEIPHLAWGRRIVVPVPALLLMLLGVTDVPAFLQSLGVADLPALVAFLGASEAAGVAPALTATARQARSRRAASHTVMSAGGS